MNIPGAANVDYQIIEEEIGERERMGTLTLLNSQPSDAGDYVCIGRNNITYARESATLVVQGISSMCIIIIKGIVARFKHCTRYNGTALPTSYT